MARIEPLGINEVHDEIRHFCEEAERQTGTSASTRTYARNPGVLKALATFRATLAREGTIDPSVQAPLAVQAILAHLRRSGAPAPPGPAPPASAAIG